MQEARGATKMSAVFDMSAFERVTAPVVRILTPDQARQVAEYRGDETLAARIEELAHRSNEGELTAAERSEYAGYVHANKFVALLQAQARRRLTDS
jgi:hypothetical protein